MIISTIPASNCTPQTIVIGRRGTYDTMQIAFDLSYLVESYGNGVAVLAVKRSQDTSAYPAVVTQEDNTLTWTVSETDTAYVGSGECQLMWYVDGGLSKTIIYPMVVMRDILQTAEEPPDGYENWIEHLTGLGAETQQNAQNAAQSASEAKESEESAAESAQRAEDAAGMLVDVSATATTLEPGQPATAEYDEGVFKFGIPKGDKLTYADLTEADKEDLVQGPIKAAQDAAVDAVGTAKTNAVDAVNGAGTTQVQNVNSAGSTQVNTVNQAGTTQVGNVNQAGATQVQAIEDKGDEVIDSIPPDYSDLTAEVDDLSRQLNDETTGLDAKAPVILETASGAIASFADGADGMPIRKLVAQIEPVQDLHGYDYPWPAGGGVNLFPLDLATIKALPRSGTWSGNSYTEAGVTITFNVDDGGNIESVLMNGTATSSISFIIANNYKLPLDLYYPFCEQVTGVNVALQMKPDESADVVAITCRGYSSAYSYRGLVDGLVWIYIGNGAAINNFVIHPMLVKEADYTAGMTYSPYSNECPISGHTGAEIERAGVNIWDEEWDRGYVDGANGGAFMAYPAYVRSKHKFRIDGGKTYYFACSRSGTLGNTGISYYDANGDFISSDVDPVNSAFTAPTKAKMMAFFVPSSWYTGDYANDISINYPATDTDYHPYTGNQISVTFPSEAGTVYGGTLDVTNGVLTVDMAMVDLGTLNWRRDTTTRPADGATIHAFYTAVNDCKITTRIPNMLSSVFKADTIRNVDYGGNNNIKDFICSGADSNHRIWVYGSIYNEMSTADFKTAMSGVQLVYELANPITYQLSAQQVPATLYGTNNIWANTGDTEVEYPCDTKLYIDGKITQAIAAALNA